MAAPGSIAFPTAGADVDGVLAITHEPTDSYSVYWLIPACPGTSVQVQAAATITAGQELETTADGRVKPRSTGKAVLRALGGAGAGAFVWCIFTSGR